jgi:hypothetical protein
MSEATMLPGVYKWCVFEYERRKQSLVYADALGNKELLDDRQPCWNLKYAVEFNTGDEEETQLAFLACGAWIENNKAPGSKYVIQELFFYEIH